MCSSSDFHTAIVTNVELYKLYEQTEKQRAETLRDVHIHIWTDACLDDGRKVRSENKQAASHHKL